MLCRTAEISRAYKARRVDRCPGCGPKPVEPEERDERALCETCYTHVRRQKTPACTRCRSTLVNEFMGKPYCARCPRQGSVAVILISPSGEEREAWHPLELCELLWRGADPMALVIASRTERDWRVGRIRMTRSRRSRF